MSSENKEKPDSFSGGSIHFLAEQTGVSENELKEALVKLFQSQKRAVRAYLAQIEYDKKNETNVALCIWFEYRDDEKLASDVSSIFRRMFGPHEHLDILFLNKQQETALRKVCCPFFSSKRVDCPDFYLTSSEGYNLEDIRACYKERQLSGSHPDGYMLCEIYPPIVGQAYGLGERDVHKIIIVSRHARHSVFHIDEWPAYVHVARLTFDTIPIDKFTVAKDDIESMGLAEIYRTPMAAETSR
ncbi:MAG: enhanced serine sensitivity protein SseB [Nitrospirae bacterium]|nr:enhanced serine sensitivity protein SseB [Candidatus Manganitrophaceae bacterium]